LSTVHCHVDSPDRFPLQSTPRTWKVYVPDGGSSCRPEEHVCHSWAPPTRHSNSRNVGSVAAEKVKLAGPLTVPFGPVTAFIVGFVSSTKRARVWRFANVAN